MKRSIWHQDYVNLRQTLLQIRLHAGLTQTELAKVLNKPQSFVAKYEKGDRNLDFIEVLKVLDACKADVDTFLKQLKK
ncbi:MAG: helix-turn-helix domain-containing protein [Thiomicrospira sp.]